MCDGIYVENVDKNINNTINDNWSVTRLKKISY